MAASKVMNGARAKLGIYDPATNSTRIVGIFNNVSYGLTFDAQPAYILGAHAPAEIDYTSQEPVSITASGWRVIDHGPHVEAGIPKLQDLLLHEYLELVIMDRQREAGGKDGRITKFHKVRPTGYSTTISARQLEEVTVTFMAILVDDESTTNTEGPGAASLPS
jgi:hypothetical protein